MGLHSLRLVETGRRIVGVGLLAAVVLGGCSSGSDSTESTTSSSVATTTTSRRQLEASVLDGYRAFWAAYLHAADPMDPESAELVASAINPQLEQVQRAFLSRLAGGEVIRGTIETHAHLEGPVGATTATVVDCYTDDSHIFDATTGAQKDDPAVVHHLVRADMALVGGTWRVAGIHHESTGCTPS